MGKGKSAIVKITPVNNPGIYLYNCILDYSAYGENGINALVLSLNNASEIPYEPGKIKSLILQKLKGENIDKTKDDFGFYFQPALLHKILQLLGLTYEQVMNFDRPQNELTLYQLQLNRRLGEIEKNQKETFVKLNSMKNNSKRFSTQKKLFLVIDIARMIGYQLDGLMIMQGKQLFITYNNVPESYFSAKGFRLATSSDDYGKLEIKQTLKNIASVLYLINNDDEHKGKTFSVDADIVRYIEKRIINNPSIPSMEDNRNYPPVYAAAFSMYAYLDALRNYLTSLTMNYDSNVQSIPALKDRKTDIVDFFRSISSSINEIKGKYFELLKFMTITASENTITYETVNKCAENMSFVLRNMMVIFGSQNNFFYTSFDKNSQDDLSLNLERFHQEFIREVNDRSDYENHLMSINLEVERFVNMVKNEYGRN